MKKADILLKSTAVFTGLKDRPCAGAVAISGNRISKVTEGNEFDDLIGENTKIYDCGDKLIMPGFVDAHFHFFMGAAAASPHMCMEIDKSTSEADCLRIIKEFAAAHPDEKRIMGWGWFPANWNDAPLPTKASLDELFPDKPAYLFCADGHTAWVNSKGLEECGITRDTVPLYGEIVKGPDGEPDGILKEAAIFPAMEKLTSFPPNVLQEIFESFLKDVAKKGITSLSDMTVTTMSDSFLQLFENLKKMEREGSFTSRLNVYSSLGPAENYDREKNLREKYGHDGIVRYAGLKHLIDGVTSTYTGILLEPYTDKPETCGEPNYEKSFFEEYTIKANREGLSVRLHCIADASVRWALDIFEKSNKVNDNPGNRKKLCNSVEHIENIHPDDIPRFKELGVIPSMQPYHLTLDANEKIVRIGRERSRWEWPHRSILDSGARLALGTDYPVVSYDPFENIYAAITRKDDDRQPTGVNPQECLTLAETLKCYTAGGACAYEMEDEIGTLEEGKLADIIVIDRNMFDISPEEIPDCSVELTIFNGRPVYER